MSNHIFQELWNTIKNKKIWSGLITNLKSDVTDFEQAKEQLSNLNKTMKHKVDELNKAISK